MTETTSIGVFGNLVRNAEAVATKGRSMTRMRVATNTTWTDAEGNHHETTEYHRVVAFGELAETAVAECKKGRRIFIEGRTRTQEFTGSDGVRRVVTEVVARSLRFFGNGGDAVSVADTASAEGTA